MKPLRPIRLRRLARLVVCALLLGLAGWSAPASAATALYPDLKTLPPRDLRLDRTDISYDGSGNMHNVLRFSNTVWNAGEGTLEMRGQIDPVTKAGPAVQRVYNTDGTYSDYTVGNFYYHVPHRHWHYDRWGEYQLWTKADYDNWIASGRSQGAAKFIGAKTTSCVMDEEFIRTLAGTPFPPVFPGNCFPDSNGFMMQGLSPGWGDTYDWYRADQWIDLNQGSLADGTYVVRSITDPDNQIYESPSRGNASREGAADNEATTTITVSGGALVDSDAPTGTVAINDVDNQTTTPNVTVKAIGRDDVSGVDLVRLSNDGTHWATYNYTATGSTPVSVNWDLSNATYGGDSTGGTKTVYAQFHDASGKWSTASATDTITLANSASGYSAAVTADSPVSYWRLGEPNGTTAGDSAGSNTGTYVNGPLLGAPSLLAADSANTAVSFDGSNDHVRVPGAASLDFTARVSLEAWIKPSALPPAGSFASVATKAEAYSLQFNGPRLEFTIMQGGGSRRRLQAPSGAVVAGQAYHVVGIYDGSNQRLYINGTQVATTPLTGAIGTTANPLVIGSWDQSGEYFKGAIDDVAVYGSVLSPSRVQAHYNIGSGTSAPVPVAAPNGLTASVASASQIDLRWTDNSSNETNFVVERDTTSNFSAPTVVTLGANATSYSDTGLTAGTTYYYRVKAKNATNTSGYSNVASAKTASLPGAYSSAVLADGPVSYWRLGDASGTTATDQKNANAGTYLNAPGLGAPSLLGSDAADKGVAFDGVNDSVRVADSASLGLTPPLTLEAWIRPASVPAVGGWATLVSKPEAYALQFNGPRLELTIMRSGIRYRLQAPSGALVAGQTYHVVGTYDGTTQRLYINGSQAASAALNIAVGSTTNPLSIGAWNAGGEFFNGVVDEVAVYRNALSAARVTAHYNAGR